MPLVFGEPDKAELLTGQIEFTSSARYFFEKQNLVVVEKATCHQFAIGTIDRTEQGYFFIKKAKKGFAKSLLARERTKPENVVLGLLSLALTGRDIGFDQGFIIDSNFRVGFKSVHSKTLDVHWDQMELHIDRK